MDRGKYKRIACLAGVILILCVAGGSFGGRAVQSVRMYEQEALGNLILSHPELESDLTQEFYGKNEDGKPLTEKQRKAARETGRKMGEKYGYSVENNAGIQEAEKDVFVCVFLFALVAMGILVCLFCEQKRSAKLRSELERLQQEQEETELHFQKVKQTLEAEEQNTKGLITDIAHQLKTPIASLKMGYEIEETTQLTKEEKEAFHRKGYEEVKKLETLLDSLMKLSKLEVKLIQIEPASCSMREILTRAVNTVYMKAYEKRIEIEMEEFNDEIMHLDRKWTGEAIVNILDNAVKYSPEQSGIHIRAEKMTTYMLVEIADEGIGIAPDEVQHIFRRFYRGEREVIKSQEGSGVGLYLARKIVELQGGTISVKRQEQREREPGSVFRITLPLGR